MLKNFINLTFRNLWKSKGYSALNILGLTLGIVAASLIFLWIEDELTYDDFPNKEHIYMVKTKQFYEDQVYVFSATAGPMSEAMADELPGVKQSARMSWQSEALFSVADKRLYQEGLYVDATFLDILSLDFIEGNKSTALNQPNAVVLTQSMAQKLFGKIQVVGENIKINAEKSYQITAVVKDFPSNSTVKFDWLINFDQLVAMNPWLESWGNYGITTLVQTEVNADIAHINEQLKTYARVKSGFSESSVEHFIYPMPRWRMYDRFDKDGNEKDGRITYVRLFGFIACIVLLIACINFMNLATARSEKRAKEVSMRKVMGADRASLIRYFVGESLVQSFLAVILAIGVLYLVIPAFNSLINKELSLNLLSPLHTGFLLVIATLCGFVAGSYPAFYLSSFNPLTALKGLNRNSGIASFIRPTLVVVQFTAAIVLMLATLVIYQQIQHTKNRDLGYDKSQVISLEIRGSIGGKLEVIKQQLLATGQVESVGVSDHNILEISSNAGGFEWENKDPNKSVLVSILEADAGLINSLNIQIFDGRNFFSNLEKEQNSVVINKTLAKMIQEDGLVTGKKLEFYEENLTIVGVIENFVFNNLYNSPEPLVIYPYQEDDGVLYVRTKADANLTQSLASIEQVIKQHNPEYPFEYRFLDETFEAFFQSDQLLQNLSQIFAILSISISCLGLFGLAAYSAEVRAKEISIRKVLGASVKQLIVLLNKEFLLLVGLALVIAFPISWWILKDWLSGYNYRMEMPWMSFVWVGALALIIALITVSSQALKAALLDPAKMLRDE